MSNYCCFFLKSRKHPDVEFFDSLYRYYDGTNWPIIQDFKCWPRNNEGGIEESLFVVNRDWGCIEMHKANSAELRLPWFDDDSEFNIDRISLHYVRKSGINDQMIVYTESEERGQRNIQTRTRPGRYLKKYFPELSEDQIQKLIANIDKVDELKIAETPDLIQWVYENGPNSCMSSPAGHYVESIHPTRIYGAGDLAIAYIINEATSRVRARCLVWPDKKYMSDYIYGDANRLRAALKASGYESGSFYGAKLLKIVKNGKTIAPFFDGDYGMDKTDSDEFFEMADSSDSKYQCKCTDGKATVKSCCDRCETQTQEYRLNHVNDERICDSCLSNMICCEGNNDYYDSEDEGEVINDSWFSHDYINSHPEYFKKCDYSEELCFVRNQPLIHIIDLNEYWHRSHACDSDLAFMDQITNQYYSIDARVEFEDSPRAVALDIAKVHCFRVNGLWYYYEFNIPEGQKADYFDLPNLDQLELPLTNETILELVNIPLNNCNDCNEHVIFYYLWKSDWNYTNRGQTLGDILESALARRHQTIGV